MVEKDENSDCALICLDKQQPAEDCTMGTMTRASSASDFGFWHHLDFDQQNEQICQ